MNGIIHVCSHPEDDNPHFRITEEKIFADIFHYIEVSPLISALICCIFNSAEEQHMLFYFWVCPFAYEIS